MSQYRNLIALQSGLQNSGSEQRQDGSNRSLANMPIYPEEEECAPVLSSFRSALGNKPRNFSTDLLQQALAAKSNLGLCDGLTRSDALQSLRSYGSSHDSLSANQPTNPSKMSELLTPASNPGYLHPGLFSLNTQAESRQEYHGQDELYNYGQDKQFAQSGSFVVNDFQIRPDHYSREDSQQNQKSNIDPNEGSFTPFRPPPQMNTVEDEDEFLYGDSTPVPETAGEAPRPAETTACKEGTGNWSDEEIMIVEDFSVGKLNNAVYESPRPNHSKETTSIPLKDLSWKSSTAWKDETMYNWKASRPKPPDALESTYSTMNRPESHEAQIATPALESSGLYPSAQQQLTSQETKSKYANAALLLKKQLDPNNLMRSSSPLESPSQMAGQAVTEKSSKPSSTAGQAVIEKSSKPSSATGHPEGSQYPHILINVEQGSNLSKKRVVSLTERDSSSSKDNRNRNASPATVQYDGDSELRETSVRVVRDISESTRYQEASKVLPARYLEDNNKQKLDNYNREVYKKKYSHQDRSPGDSPWRISESNYRHRSPSPERRSRGRSRSPGYRSRNRSRPRQSEDFRREKSPRQRFRSRGRSPTQRYEERPRRDKSTDARMYGKRQHSPENSPGDMDKRPTLGKKTADVQKPIPPSVEASLSAETFEGSGLFPKSMSPDMAAMFMRDSRPPTSLSTSKKPKEPTKSTPPEQYSDPVLDSTNEKIVVQKLLFTLKQVQQSDVLNDLVATMQEEEEAEKVSILAQKVQLAMDANAREAQVAAAYPQANSFSQPPPAVPYSSLTMYPPPVSHPSPTLNVAEMPQPYAYGMQSYSTSATPTFPVSLLPTPYSYNQPMYNSQGPPNPSPAYNSQGPPNPSPAYNNQGAPTPSPVYKSQVPLPQPSTSKLANAAPATASRWLRNVPVLSAEEISKSKESEDELLAQYRKRVQERDLIIKKLNNLSNQMVELKKMRVDFEKKSKKVRSGDDAQFISKFQELQERGNAELRLYIEEAKTLKEEVQKLEKKIPPHLLRCKEKVNVLSTDKVHSKVAQEENRPIYSCFDPGENWCVQCSTLFSTIPELVQHLHTQEHLQHEGSCESAANKEPQKVDRQGTHLKPAKGLEFLKPLSAFYCTLCEETLMNPKYAEQHLKGHDHTVKYLAFLQENPIYEDKRDLMIGARASALAKANRLKELSDISKAREIILKKKQEDEQLLEVQGRLRREKQLPDPLQELDEGVPIALKKARMSNKVALADKDRSKEPSGEVKKPKAPVIYIGRAPNYRPKAKETKETEKISAKVGSRTSTTSELIGSSASKTPAHKPAKSLNESPKEIEIPSNRNTVSKVDRKSTQDRSRREDVPTDKKRNETFPKIKVFGCQSEAESKRTEPQRKGLRTVQLQMNEPKTDNPAVNQALKNILYGSEKNLPGKDTKLSAIKLPESPPLPPPLPPRSDKVAVEPKAKLQQKKPLTEEEKDFILLGINKSDMMPIATPKPPPSSLLPKRASSPAKATEKNFPPSRVKVPSSLSVPLPDVTVPPPNLNRSPSNVPLPNLQVPPPNLQIPPPNLHVPPPSLHIPNMQVPPPNMLLHKAPALHIPFGQACNTPSRIHGTGYHPHPQVHYPSQVVDMDLDFEGGTGSEIHVGSPRYNSASVNIVVPFQRGPAIERRSGIANKPKPLAQCKEMVVLPDKNKVKILKTAQSGSDASKAIVTKQNAPHNGLKTVISSVTGSNEDRLICTSVLNSVIQTVLEKHLNNSSEDINTTSDTHSSSASEPNVIGNFTDLKTPKGGSSELDMTSSFAPTESTAVEELERLANKTIDVDDIEEIDESEGIVSCLKGTNAETSDFKQVLDSNTVDSIPSSVSIIDIENNNKLESEVHQESLLLNADNVKIKHIISNQEDLTSLNNHVPSLNNRLKIPNVKQTTGVGTSQCNINNKENNALKRKELEPSCLETTNNSQPVIEETLDSVTALQESLVILEEKSLSSDQVSEKPDGIATIENKSEQSSCEEINLINPKDISKSPLIHSIEHFIDDNVVHQPHEAFVSADKSPKNPSTKQEVLFQDENAGTISTAEENIPKSPIKITEGSSLELSISGVESMDVEQTDIPSSSTVNENVRNSPIAVINGSSLELCVSSIESMKQNDIPSISTAERNILKCPIEGTKCSSLELSVSCIESMDVEQTNIPISSTIEKNVQNTPIEVTNSSSLELHVSSIESMEQIDIPSISTVEGNIPKTSIEVTESSSLELSVSGVVSMDVEHTNTPSSSVEENIQNTSIEVTNRSSLELCISSIESMEQTDIPMISTTEGNIPKSPIEGKESSSLELSVSGIDRIDFEQTNIPSISTIEENVPKSPIDGTECHSLELCVSGTEGAVVEKIHSAVEDSQISLKAIENTQTLSADFNSQDTRVSGIEIENNDAWIVVEEEVNPETGEITEGSSLGLPISGIESMDVEETNIPYISTVEADLQIPFVAIENTQTLGAEINSPATQVAGVLSIDVGKNDTLIAMTEKADPETAAADPISNPQRLDSENNSLYSCILGTGSFDTENQNSPALGSDRSEESVSDRLDANTKLSSTSPEENLKKLEVLETNNGESGSEDLIKTNQCPMDIESSVNEIAIENAMGNTILSSCKVHPLDEEFSVQKSQSKEEIRNLNEETVCHVQAEDKQENIETKFLKKDVPENLLQIENQEATKHPVNTLINPDEEMGQFIPPVIDHSSSNLESVPSPGAQKALQQDLKTTDEPKTEETSSSEAFYLGLSEDSCSRGNSGVSSSVPCLEKFDLDDSRSNSTLDDPPVLSEISINKKEPTSENICHLTTGIEKKADSDTDEYETEDGAE